MQLNVMDPFSVQNGLQKTLNMAAFRSISDEAIVAPPTKQPLPAGEAKGKEHPKIGKRLPNSWHGAIGTSEEEDDNDANCLRPKFGKIKLPKSSRARGIYIKDVTKTQRDEITHPTQSSSSEESSDQDTDDEKIKGNDKTNVQQADDSPTVNSELTKKRITKTATSTVRRQNHSQTAPSTVRLQTHSAAVPLYPQLVDLLSKEVLGQWSSYLDTDDETLHALESSNARHCGYSDEARDMIDDRSRYVWEIIENVKPFAFRDNEIDLNRFF